jgi:hypothetical protein
MEMKMKKELGEEMEVVWLGKGSSSLKDAWRPHSHC